MREPHCKSQIILWSKQKVEGETKNKSKWEENEIHIKKKKKKKYWSLVTLNHGALGRTKMTISFLFLKLLLFLYSVLHPPKIYALQSLIVMTELISELSCTHSVYYLRTGPPHSSFQGDDYDGNIIVILSSISLRNIKQLIELHPCSRRSQGIQNSD